MRKPIFGLLSGVAGTALAVFELLRPHVPAVGPELIRDAAMMGMFVALIAIVSGLIGFARRERWVGLSGLGVALPFIVVFVPGVIKRFSGGTLNSEKRFIEAFSRPITFYGQVVDQHGDPVGQADVKMAANDKAFGGRPSEYTTRADSRGLFSITDIVGLTLAVEVSKPGHLAIPPADNKVTFSGVFEYGLSSIRGPHRPSKEAPVIFALCKLGPTEPLVKVGDEDFRIARDGSPLTISLDRGQNHQVILRCWNSDASRPEGQRQYDWRLEITVPNGGLVYRNDAFTFEAPQDGYVSSDMIEMLASLPAGKWRGMAERAYFIRFDDGIFARASLEMHAGGDHFVVWESFLNPKAGSRMLEADPKMRPSVR